MMTALTPLTPGVWRIEGQGAPSDAFHPYVVLSQERTFLIDCPIYSAALRKSLEAIAPLTAVLLSHAAASGPSSNWQRTGTPIWLHPDDRQDRWLRIDPDRHIADGMTLTTQLRSIHTPGHSLGHTMFLFSGTRVVLFSGDGLYVVGGRLRADMDASSRARICALTFDVLAPYHYDGIAEAASDAARVALSRGAA